MLKWNKVQWLSILNFPGQCVTNSMMEISLMCQCGFCCPLIPESSRHSDLCTLFNMYNIFKLLSRSKKNLAYLVLCKLVVLHQRLPERGRSIRDLGDVHIPLLFLLFYQTLSSIPCSFQIHPTSHMLTSTIISIFYPTICYMKIPLYCCQLWLGQLLSLPNVLFYIQIFTCVLNEFLNITL